MNNLLTNSSTPKDLRGSSPAQAGGGKMHTPDPEAVKRLQARLAATQRAKEASAATAVAAAESQPPATVEVATPQRRSLERPIDPSVYPAAVREEAAKQLAKDPAKRRYAKVFTPEVVAVWQQFVNEGKSTEWLAAYNGLVPVVNETIRNYLGRYKGTIKKETAVKPATPPQPAAQAETAPTAVAAAPPADDTATPAAQETAVAANPAPKAVTQAAITQPTQLQSLAALLDAFAREPIKLHGRISINLEIEIGGAE